jgi:tRNA (mo5U34)-methyltransferase
LSITHIREGLALPTTFPESVQKLLAAGDAFARHLDDVKRRVAVPDYGWYPYSTMTALPTVAALLDPVYEEVRAAIAQRPVADIGCGDGDLGLFFASLGASAGAIDHAETNFNQLRGVSLLSETLGTALAIDDIDLDRPFRLPEQDYSLALFLGTLYHLKNPLYVLENLAGHADWCVLSTRIAQVTPGGEGRMEGLPLAYLLGAREANNDPTNFWIFSMAGLVRLLERSGWMVMGQTRLGCGTDSDPVRPDADERALVLAKSRLRHPGLHARTAEGWHAVEDGAFRWTTRRFALEVTLPDPAREFALRISVPEAAVQSGPVRVACTIAGMPAGTLTCASGGALEFRGRFPSAAVSHRLEFTVESGFTPPGDARELGVCVPLLDPRERHLQRIPFRIS